MIHIKEIEDFKEYGNCLSLENEDIEIIVSKKFGPRILYYGFKDEFNHLCEHAKESMYIGDEKWQMYGGHRFWHSPEQNPRTYIPDNDPIEIEDLDNGIRLIQNLEDNTNLKKTIDILIDEKGTKVKIIHRLKNLGYFDVNLALWPLTCMRSGGVHIVPLNTNDTGFLANRSLSIWPYTDIKDERLDINNTYIKIEQKNLEKKLKIGVKTTEKWATYINKGQAFIKTFDCSDELYPDGDCNYEVFTNSYMLEMESLSQIHNIKQGEEKTHIENWMLLKSEEKDMSKLISIIDDFVK